MCKIISVLLKVFATLMGVCEVGRYLQNDYDIVHYVDGHFFGVLLLIVISCCVAGLADWVYDKEKP